MFKAAIFDLDGVIAQTPHFQAWKLAFETKVGIPEFTVREYATHVSGKPRKEGLRSFLQVSGIEIDEEKIDKFAADKQKLLMEIMENEGVEAFSGTIELMKKLKEKGIKIAVASSSENTPLVLKKAYTVTKKGDKISASLLDIVDAVIANKRIIANDKDVIDSSIKGKPEPDIFLTACRELSVKPEEAIGFEDAASGIEAFTRGGIVSVGIDRDGSREALKAAGANVVVEDLSQISIKELENVYLSAKS